MLAMSSLVTGIQSWVKACEPEGVTHTVLAHHGNPRPPRPFVTLQVTSVSGIHQPDHRALLEDNETLPIYQDVKIMVSVMAYGEGALGIMMNIRSGMQRITTERSLYQAGMAYIRDHGCLDLTLETEDPRAGMDIELRAMDVILDDVGCIETVIGAGVVKEAPDVNERKITIHVEG